MARLPPPIILLAFIMGACTTVGPDFKSPSAPADEASGYAAPGDPTPANVRLEAQARVAGPWWLAFQSPELNEVISLALATSPTVAEATATLERAQAELNMARGEQRAQADLTASARRTRINSRLFGFSNFTPPTINLYSIGSSVSYDLDLFGGGRRATERAAAMAEVARQEADAAYLTLSGNVARQAMMIAALQAEIAAIEAVIADDRRIFEMVKRAYAEGGAPLSDAAAAYKLMTDSEASLPRVQRDLATARHQLALLVGRAPGTWSAPDFDLQKISAPSEIPVALPSVLLRQRPDILAAEAELHAATAAIGVAEASRYPDIQLTATLTQTATTPESLFGYSGSGWNLFSGLTAPILNGGVLKARQRAAEAEARVALARYQHAVLRAFVQVSDGLSDLGADSQTHAADLRSLAAAEATLRTAHAAYAQGGANMRQVIEVQQEVSRARQVAARSRGQQLVDLVALYAATATDWATPKP